MRARLSEPQPVNPAPLPHSAPQSPPPLYHRGWVYFMLFVVLGVFALPILYKSPCFSAREKIALTVIVSVYSLAMLLLLIVGVYYYLALLLPLLKV